jgi:FtsZ-binding cell division protein ZapB
MRTPEEIATEANHSSYIWISSADLRLQTATHAARLALAEREAEVEKLTRERDSARKSRDEFESACFNLRQDHVAEVERLKGELAELEKKYLYDCGSLQAQLSTSRQEGINEGLEMAAKYVDSGEDLEWMAKCLRSLKVKS